MWISSTSVSGDTARVERAILKTARAVRHAYKVRLSEVGLTMTEASLLSFLDARGVLTQRALADLLQITPASTGSVIDGLERRALVERVADPADRRVWQITLTAAGAPFAAEFRRVDAELRVEVRAGLSEAEQHELARMLELVEERAVSAASGRSGPVGKRRQEARRGGTRRA